jgi:purine-binding chemotaxis protein CheW
MKQLARANTDIQDQAGLGEGQQYLTFMVAGEMFGFGIQNIREIIEFGNVTQVPMMPRFVRGVINLRGNVVPVIDLAARFQRDLSVINKRTCIVIVELESEAGRQDIGVVVDSVCEVLDIMPQDIEPPPSFGLKIHTAFIHGMGKVNDKFVIILATGNP